MTQGDVAVPQIVEGREPPREDGRKKKAPATKRKAPEGRPSPRNQVGSVKFTAFNPMGYLNAKNMASEFGRSAERPWSQRRLTDEQWFQRRDRDAKRTRRLFQTGFNLLEEEEMADKQDKEKDAESALAAQDDADLHASDRIPQLSAEDEKMFQDADVSRDDAAKVDDEKGVEDDKADDEKAADEKADDEGKPVDPTVRTKRKKKSKLSEAHMTPTVGSVVTSADLQPRTVAVHIGSRTMRLGFTNSREPHAIPSCVARRKKGHEKNETNANAISENTHAQGESTQNSAGDNAEQGPPVENLFEDAMDVDEENANNQEADNEEADNEEADNEEDDYDDEDAATEESLSRLRADLKLRMKAQKLRAQPNGTYQAAQFNANTSPESLNEVSDALDIEWTNTNGRDVLVGTDALNIPHEETDAYDIRWPIERGLLNVLAYDTTEEIWADLEFLWRAAFQSELGLDADGIAHTPLCMIMPDVYEGEYVREMTDFLLRRLGFPMLMYQQESLCAAFGSGLSTGCVIDMGARKTAIACIDEGMVVPESRVRLDYGGDDITSFLFKTLRASSLQYPESLALHHDFDLVDSLKERILSLAESDVGLNIYDYVVRKHNENSLKYQVRTYDEGILASYLLFAPDVIDFARRDEELLNFFSLDIDDCFDLGGPLFRLPSQAMLALAPAPAALYAEAQRQREDAEERDRTDRRKGDKSKKDDKPDEERKPRGREKKDSKKDAKAADKDTSNTDKDADKEPDLESESPAAPGTDAALALTSMRNVPRGGSPAPQLPGSLTTEEQVLLESSRAPLDVALAQSILAVPGDDKRKKICQSIVATGGTALIHGLGPAVHSRLAHIMSYSAPDLVDSIAVIPVPHGHDPRIIAWRGLGLVSKLESAVDMWVRADDWDTQGLRALKDRTIFF